MKKRIVLNAKPAQRFLVKFENEAGTVMVNVETEISEHEFVRDVLTVETTTYKYGRKHTYSRAKYVKGGIVPKQNRTGAEEFELLKTLKSQYKRNPERFSEKTIKL